MRFRFRLLIASFVLFGILFGMAASGLAADKLKAGFIYVGPIGDYGWTHAHNQAREMAEKAFPWLETTYVESVPEGEVGVFIDRLVQQGAQVIFTTSFGFMDGTLEAAKRHPDIIFAHATGFKTRPEYGDVPRRFLSALLSQRPYRRGAHQKRPHWLRRRLPHS